ncbi:MAG TPA: PAS domain-containing protein, partial [Candidatus Sulfotelmatobacter sp.]|nr:PAS domain-containing protein [Candidatus Sulfotelmatobacter sp.]
MLWPIVTLLAVASLVALHLWWRAKFEHAQDAARRQRDLLEQVHQQATLQFRTQQEALFNSMVEGLLLLDETGRVQLANRAFLTLFNITVDIRSRTIMETLRLHELAELVEALGTQKQVLGQELRLSFPTERLIQVNGAAIFNGDSRRHGTILVFHDLTRLKQLE